MATISFIVSSLFLLVINCNILHSSAVQFAVGGRDGWVLNPRESYDHWARRLRFQVNDTVVFRYFNTTDSVLAVGKDDYENCNVDNPVIKLYGGESVFEFGHSGPFYFITGNKTNCDKGQKLLIVVLAVRSPPAIPSTPPAPSAFPPTAAPSSSPPIAQPPAGSPSASLTPSGPVAPGPSASTPEGSAAPAAVNTSADVNAPAPSPAASFATATFTSSAVSTITVFVFTVTLGWSFTF